MAIELAAGIKPAIRRWPTKWVDDIDLAAAFAGDVMIEIKHSRGIEELAVLLVEAAEAAEFLRRRGRLPGRKAVSPAFDAASSAPAERRGCAEAGAAQADTQVFPIRRKICERPKRRTRIPNVLAVGVFMRDQQDALRRSD